MRLIALGLAACLWTAFVAGCPAARGADAAPQEYDVVVYGGTSGGVVAAIQAARMGKSVVLIEPGRHVGGLTTGGLGATDIGNKAAIGGISREFYRRLGEYYQQDSAWTWQSKEQFRSDRRRAEEEEMWVFEPHVAEQVYRDMLKEAGVPVVFGERLDLQNGVTKAGGRIQSIRMESGRTFRGKMFIDATYEGDLMAEAGVSYHVGREANATYGETLNGVQVRNATKHQFIVPVDPYVKKGDPSSGLLPLVQEGDPGQDGEGDRRVQAYNFRMCTTDVPENQVDWPKPADYDPQRYELLLRNFEAGDRRVPWNPVMMPNRKTDTNNNFAISTDHIGANYEYPDGDYATRKRIWDDHVSYQQGLMWTLANNPRVPEDVQKHFRRWKPAKDEFVDNNHWPHQLYVREARRMISDYVMTQHNCQGRELANDPVGLAAYTMDSHNVQRYAKDGRVWNEGDVQVGGFAPYPISYRSIVPKKSECENLLVPVCLSASHIAYGSIRMEPVFMVLGQSAATAAAQAIDTGRAVQEIDYAALREKLRADQQVLEWTGPRPQPREYIDPNKLPGIVMDDVQAEREGNWQQSASVPGFVGNHYLHDGNEGKGQLRAVFRPKFPDGDAFPPGRYEVRLSWTANPNRATNVPVTITHADGTKRLAVNQRKAPNDRTFQSLGTFRFDRDAPDQQIVISNEGTDGHVIVDAVQLIPAKENAKDSKSP